MLQRLFKFIGISANTASFVDYLIKILVGLGIIGGGSVMAFSVYASSLYEAYGNAAVAGGALLGALCVALILLAAASALRKLRESQLFAALSQAKTSFNPKDDNYSNQVFRIQDMFLPLSHILEQKTFHNCDIIGPGVIMFDGHVAFHGRIDLLECGDIIFPPIGTYLTSVLIVRNCTFRNCRFFRTGLVTSSEAVLNVFMRFGARDPRVQPQPAAEAPITLPNPQPT